MDERPPDHIIEDNEALDSFLLARKSKIESEQRKARLANSAPNKGKREHVKLL